MVSHLTYTYRVALCVFVCCRYRPPSVLAAPPLPHSPPPPLHPPLIMCTHSPSELTPLVIYPLLCSPLPFFHAALFITNSLVVLFYSPSSILRFASHATLSCPELLPT